MKYTNKLSSVNYKENVKGYPSKNIIDNYNNLKNIGYASNLNNLNNLNIKKEGTNSSIFKYIKDKVSNINYHNNLFNIDNNNNSKNSIINTIKAYNNSDYKLSSSNFRNYSSVKNNKYLCDTKYNNKSILNYTKNTNYKDKKHLIVNSSSINNTSNTERKQDIKNESSSCYNDISLINKKELDDLINTNESNLPKIMDSIRNTNNKKVNLNNLNNLNNVKAANNSGSSNAFNKNSILNTNLNNFSLTNINNISSKYYFNDNSTTINSINQEKKAHTNFGVLNNNLAENNSNLNNALYKKEIKIIGLANLGNTCYMNTSLQMILSCQLFIEELLNYSESKLHSSKSVVSVASLNKDSKKSYSITKSFINFIKQYYNSQNNTSSISPSELKRTFSCFHKSFAGYDQHDSQEFLRLLLDDISNDSNRIINKPKFKEIKNKGKSKESLHYEYLSFYENRENSIVTDNFYGLIINNFKCEECNTIAYSFERFMEIPIYIEKSSICSVDELLYNNFYKKTKIFWETLCDGCNKKTYHIKTSLISKLPKYFIISLQRYNYKSNSKNSATVNFNEELNLKNIIDDNICLDNTEYKLISISNHKGSLNFGHYFAVCKSTDGIWYECNDSNISKISNYILKSNYCKTACVYIYKSNII